MQRWKRERYLIALGLLPLLICFAFVVKGFTAQSLAAFEESVVYPLPGEFDIHADIERYAIEFFTNNGAAELIPIIRCESQFRHYDSEGAVLMNHEGSSATGIAQILASMHPDPQVIKKYNRRHGVNARVEDFDIMTPIGNLEYALVLYEIRGTRDWECAKQL